MGQSKHTPIPLLLLALRDNDPSVRREAISALSTLGRAAAVAFPEVLTLLRSDQDIQVRVAAATALGSIIATEGTAVSALVEALGDSAEAVRWEAARTLAGMGPTAKDAFQGLVEILKNGGHAARHQAAWLLGVLGPAPALAVPVLMAALADENPDICQSAAQALELMGLEARDAIPSLASVLATPDGDDDACEAAARALAVMGPLAIPHLLTPLRFHDERRWGWATRALGAMGRAAFPVLVSALRFDRSWARRVVATALMLPDPADVPQEFSRLLDDGLVDGSEFLKVAIERGVTRKGTLKVLTYGLPPNEATRSILRGAAARALGAMGPAAGDAVPVLVEALKDEDHRVGENAARALGAMGPASKGAVPALIEALTDERGCLNTQAARALAAMGPAAGDAVPALIEALHDQNAALREAADEALSVIDPVVVAVGESQLYEEGKSLRVFYLIGKTCRERGDSSFTFTDMAQILNERWQVEISPSHLRNYMTDVVTFFRKYHGRPGLELFEREQGRPVTILPRGWQAWRVTQEIYAPPWHTAGGPDTADEGD